IRSLLHGVHTFYAFFLMMVFMTYNGFLCTAIIVGAVTGFFVFGRYKVAEADKQTSCH
ncbi:hypothetical protein ROZALSC1DRAFT_15438, partial [Rozella allomycis CSF55]